MSLFGCGGGLLLGRVFHVTTKFCSLGWKKKKKQPKYRRRKNASVVILSLETNTLKSQEEEDKF